MDESVLSDRVEIITLLRESPFRGIAEQLESHIASGKSERVRGKRIRSRGGTSETIYESIPFEVKTSGTGDFAVRVSEYTEEERYKIVLMAVFRQFVEARKLIDALQTTLGVRSLGDITFASYSNPNDVVTAAEYANFLRGNETERLAAALRDVGIG